MEHANANKYGGSFRSVPFGLTLYFLNPVRPPSPNLSHTVPTVRPPPLSPSQNRALRVKVISFGAQTISTHTPGIFRHPCPRRPNKIESPAPFLDASIALALVPSTYLTALSGSTQSEIRRRAPRPLALWFVPAHLSPRCFPRSPRKCPFAFHTRPFPESSATSHTSNQPPLPKNQPALDPHIVVDLGLGERESASL